SAAHPRGKPTDSTKPTASRRGRLRWEKQQRWERGQPCPPALPGLLARTRLSAFHVQRLHRFYRVSSCPLVARTSAAAQRRPWTQLPRRCPPARGRENSRQEIVEWRRRHQPSVPPARRRACRGIRQKSTRPRRARSARRRATAVPPSRRADGGRG